VGLFEPAPRPSRHISTITVEVDVYLEREPDMFTPDAHEPGYDYIVIREVRATATQLTGGKAIVDCGDLDDLDPDGLISDVIRKALTDTMSDAVSSSEQEG